MEEEKNTSGSTFKKETWKEKQKNTFFFVPVSLTILQGFCYLICFMCIFPGGGTHIFGRTGMYRSNGSLFYKKSLNMGPVFYPKKMSQLFWLSPNFRVFTCRKSWNSWKMGLFFKKKNLKNGYPFLPISPLKMGRGFEAWAAHPCPTQILGSFLASEND